MAEVDEVADCGADALPGVEDELGEAFVPGVRDADDRHSVGGEPLSLGTGRTAAEHHRAGDAEGLEHLGGRCEVRAGLDAHGHPAEGEDPLDDLQIEALERVDVTGEWGGVHNRDDGAAPGRLIPVPHTERAECYGDGTAGGRRGAGLLSEHPGDRGDRQPGGRRDLLERDV